MLRLILCAGLGCWCMRCVDPGEPARPRSVRVCAIQCSSVLGDVEGNSAKIDSLTRRAAGRGAKIIVLPEAAITGYLSQDLRTNWHLPGRPIAPAFRGKDPRPFAEPVPGPSTDRFGKLAKELGIYLTVPFVEIDTTDSPAAGSAGSDTTARLYNTVCLISPDGAIVAHYRKLYPWYYPEKSWVTDGDRGVQVFDTEYGRVGLAICYDIHAILDNYFRHEIWALLYPIAWVDRQHPEPWFRHELPEKVSRHGHYVIGANWSVDNGQEWFGYGYSTIIGPAGEVIASAQSLYGSELVYADIKTAWSD